jgi:transcriptional regulator GlxA family with amidase domain
MTDVTDTTPGADAADAADAADVTDTTASPTEPPPVALVVWDGVELLDLAGPGQVFATAGCSVTVVAARPGPVSSQGFLTLVPAGLVRDVRGGILVVPGGSSDRARADVDLMDGIRRAAESVDLILSVCTGALLLARAGLLDGLRATTWHGALSELRALSPGTEVVDGVRWVDNGRIVTAAGVSAGIDASLHVVARLLGTAVRDRVARYMEYPVRSTPHGAENAR